jgi:hypothetical protein
MLITKICGVKILEVESGQPLDKYLTQQFYETILLFKVSKVVAGAGSVKSSAGT